MSGNDAFGTMLQRGNGATPEVFSTIARVADISGPGIKRDTYDGTTHDSPEQWEEIVAGIKRSGEVTLDVRYSPLIHDSLLADVDDKTARSYRLVWPTEPVITWQLKMWITGFEPKAPHDDLLAASVTFKVTGKPAFA